MMKSCREYSLKEKWTHRQAKIIRPENNCHHTLSKGQMQKTNRKYPGGHPETPRKHMVFNLHLIHKFPSLCQLIRVRLFFTTQRYDKNCNDINENPWDHARKNGKKNPQQAKQNRINTKVLSHPATKPGKYVIASTPIQMSHWCHFFHTANDD